MYSRNQLLWVQGEAGAKAYIVAPYQTVLLLDSEEQKFYIKSADFNGVPTMKTYEYTEVVTEEKSPYITRDELMAELKKLKENKENNDE